MSTQSWAENIAHNAMHTYKGGEPNFSPGTSVSDATPFSLIRITTQQMKN
jgi:hypothetical protein